MRYFVDGDVVDVESRSLVILHSDQSHFLLDESSSFDMVVAVISRSIHASQPTHPPLFRRDRPSHTAVRLSVAAFDEIRDLAERIASATEKDALASGLSWWLHRAWIHWQQAASSSVKAADRRVASALEIIRNDPGSPIARVASQIGISQTRLGQLFAQETGMTMREYRSRQRIQRVQTLLDDDPKLPLLTAAMRAGWGDYSSFYRELKRTTGLSPREMFRLNNPSGRKGGANSVPEIQGQTSQPTGRKQT